MGTNKGRGRSRKVSPSRKITDAVKKAAIFLICISLIGTNLPASLLSFATESDDTSVEVDTTVITSDDVFGVESGSNAVSVSSGSSTESGGSASVRSVKAETASNASQLSTKEISATIYTDDSYETVLMDGTTITLQGKMPKGAVAKAYPVEVEIEDITVLAAYDITIFDGDGEEYEPDEDNAIEVTIDNEEIREALEEEVELTVFHMEDEDDEPEQIAKLPPKTKKAKFNAKHFSIYIVGTDGTLTDMGGETVDAYTVNFYEWVYGDEEDSDDVNPIATEKVVGNDYLNEPEVPEIEHHVFDGWFTVEQDSYNEHPGYQFDFSKTVEENLASWTGYNVGEENVINLYSDYDPIYYVYYMTEEKYDDEGNPDETAIFFTDEYYEGNLILDTTSAESLYSASHITSSQAVESWYYYDESGERKTIESGATVTDNMTLYPVVADAIWIYFVMGDEAGENVEALDPIYVLGNAETIGDLPTPEMSGYDFVGWYTVDEEEVTSGSKPQDLVDEATGWITLYAHWTPATVGYTVNIWRQKATDGQLGLDQKVVQDGEKYSTYINYYDYAESFTVSAEQSQLKTGDTPTTSTVNNWNTWTGYGWKTGTGNNASDGTGDYIGFEYNQTRTENDLATVAVQADGSTIINIFYDRVTVTYHFGTSTNADSRGTLIGLYDTNTKVADDVEPGGTLNGWPDPGERTEWHYLTSFNSYTGMSFLAKFALTENQSYRSNIVYFTSNTTDYSATLYYYLEVTNPEKQVTDTSQTTTVNGTTYVLDYTLSFGKSSATSSFTITDKYIGYTAVGFKTSANGQYQALTSQNNPVTLNNNGTLYIFNNANTYYIELYSNHDGEQLIESTPFKYGEDLTSYILPTELDAEKYGPNYYYHFTGTWFEDPSFTAEFIKPVTMPNYNLVAYADWELNEVEITFQSYVESDLYDVLVSLYGEDAVTIVSDGADDEDGNPLWAYSIIVTAGDELNYDLDDGLTSKVEDHDYEYAGWLDTGTNKVFNFLSKVYTDTTLQVFWIEEEVIYHIQYNINQEDYEGDCAVLGHSHESTSWAEVRELTDVFEDADDTDFICWNTEPDGSGTDYYPDDDLDFTKVTAEAVYDDEGEFLYYVYNLYAIWAIEKTASLDLEYNYPEGYEADVTNEVITGANLESVSLSGHSPAVTTITITDEDGNITTYRFAGWAYDEGAKEADISANDTVAVDNIDVDEDEGTRNVLYAVWLAVEPDWTVEKELTNNGTGVDGTFRAGETATFTITVSNTGDELIEQIVIAETLDGATFKDSEDDSYMLNEDKTVATITDLAVGDSVKLYAEYTIQEGDLGTELANSITTEGGDPDDPIPGPGDEEPIPTYDPHLTVTKEATSKPANGSYYVEGEEIIYKITVTNDGNVTIENITVKDPLTGLTETLGSLEPDESKEFTTSYTVMEDDIKNGSVVNEATATAPDPEDPDKEIPNTPGTDEEDTEKSQPSLIVKKTSDVEEGHKAELGEKITYTIEVINNGNVTLTGITVTDDLTGDSWTVSSLKPGESKIFTATYEVTEDDILAGSVANVAAATAPNPNYDPDDPDSPKDVTGTDEEEVTTEDTDRILKVEKTADVADNYVASLGDEITYTITVTNEGNVTLKDVKVEDKKTGFEETIASLAPGESRTFTTTYTVTEEDIENGSVVNEAAATAPNPNYDPNDPDSSENVTGTGEKEIPTYQFFPMDEEIVPNNDNERSPQTWIKQESVNEYDKIEIEMSTTLPKVPGDILSANSYSMTFHNVLDADLVLDEVDSDFTVDINGTPIEHKYYDIEGIEAAQPLSVFQSVIQFFSGSGLPDGCSFHVNIDLAALYADGVIDDDDLGTATVRVFFYVDLENNDISKSYTSTAWYDVAANGTVVYTSEQSTVAVYTYELAISKTSTSTGNPLAGATFGLYYDEDCTQEVIWNGEHYTVTSDEDGKVMFDGLAEGTYYLKELEAPSGYVRSNQVFEITLGREEVDMTVSMDKSADDLIGVVFEVYYDADLSDPVIRNDATYTVTVDSDGKVTFESLAGGTYYLRAIGSDDEPIVVELGSAYVLSIGNAPASSSSSHGSSGGSSGNGGGVRPGTSSGPGADSSGSGSGDSTGSDSSSSIHDVITSDNLGELPATGESNMTAILIGLCAVFVVLLGVLFYMRRKVQEDQL